MVITNSTFTGNNATYGGGIYADVAASAAKLLVTSSNFTNNRALQGGGLIAFSNSFNALGNVQLTQSRFTSNVATQTGGAAVLYTTGSTAIRNSVFEQNQAASGGAVYLPLSSEITDPAIIQGSTFNLNSATGADNGIYSNGGAIFTANAVSVSNTVFSNNIAVVSGGAIEAQSTIELLDSALSSNRAAKWGGAVFFDFAAVPTVARNLFSSNNASSGGAIYSSGQTLSLDSNQFGSNRATTGSGSAVFSAVGSLTVSGGAFEYNVAPLGSAALYSAGVTSVTGTSFLANRAAWSGALACVSSTVGSSAFPLTISGATFDSNEAVNGSAGAVNAGVCTATITNTVFSGNEAELNGGALFSDNALTLRVTGSSFVANYAGASGAGIYANSVDSIYLNTVTASDNVADVSGGLLAVNASTTVLELRGVSASGSLPTDYYVDRSAGATSLSVVDSATPGAIEVSSGTVTITSASRVFLAGLHLLGDASLVTNTDVNVTSSFRWNSGSISAAPGKSGAVAITVGPAATANFERSALNANSTRALRGVHLHNYGSVLIGYIANPNANGSYPLDAPKEVPCLTLYNGANIVAFNLSRTLIGYNCLVSASTSNTSRLNVSGVFHVDGSVVLELGLTIFNRSANTFFHVRNLKSGEDDFDNIVIRGRNDSTIGGLLSIRNEGGVFKPAKDFTYTATILKAPYVLGNFSEQNITVGGGEKADEPYGLVKHTLLDAVLTVDEKNRPDPNSGNTVVIVVSVILALIAVGVLILYARTIYKCLCRKKGDDEEEEEAENSDSDEEQPLTKKNTDSEKREAEEMAKVDAAEKKGKKGKKDSTKEVELREVEVDDEAPARKSKKNKQKEPEAAAVPVATEEPGDAKKSEKKSKKSSKTAEEPAAEAPKSAPAAVAAEKPAKSKKGSKAEISEEVSSSDDASESDEKPKKKTEEKAKEKSSSKKKQPESSDSSSESK